MPKRKKNQTLGNQVAITIVLFLKILLSDLQHKAILDTSSLKWLVLAIGTTEYVVEIKHLTNISDSVTISLLAL